MSVTEAVQSLRIQLEAAWVERNALPEGTQLTPESVTVSLGLTLDADSNPDQPVWRPHLPQDLHPPAHSVQIRFRRSSSTTTTDAVPSMEATEPLDRPVEQQLEDVLGSPGFDNSARAEVLHDCLAPLSLEDALVVLNWCRQQSSPPSGHPLQMAWGQIQRVLNFSPTGPVRASEILSEVVQQGHLPQALKLLFTRWRYGTHWVPSQAG